MNKPLFTYEADGHVLIVHLPEELDHHNCTGLKYETDLILSENYINRIVFDFSGTGFMDSSGIGVLLGRHDRRERELFCRVFFCETGKCSGARVRLAGL